MKLTEDHLKELIRQHTGRSARGDAECLGEDTLMRVVAHDLSREEHEKVVKHLGSCSDCALEYRVVRSLKSWVDEDEVISGSEPSISHGTRRQQLVRARAARSLPRALFSYPYLLVPLVASVLIIVSLCGWIAIVNDRHAITVAMLNDEIAGKSQALQTTSDELEKTQDQLREANRRLEQGADAASDRDGEIAKLRELSKPQLNVPIIDLDPSLSRDTAQLQVAEIPSGRATFTLILHTSGKSSSPNLDFDIVDHRSKPIV